MIQRIQSLFLLVAIAAMVLLAFFPMASFYSDTGIYVLGISGLDSLTPGNEVPFVTWFFYPLPVVAALIIILDVVALLAYKKRLRQIRILQGTILLTILFVVGIMFYYVPAIEENTGTVVDYRDSTGIYLPLISLVFSLLAQHYIKKDEKLVRSVDRLR
jgi:hypothetical protein